MQLSHQCTYTVYTVCAFSVACMFSLLEDGGVATQVNVSMSTCMCICTMLYLIVFHLSGLFTYPNKMFVAFDQWGSDNRGFTVLELLHLLLQLCFMLKTGTYKGGRSLMYNEKDYLLLRVCHNFKLLLHLLFHCAEHSHLSL